MDATSTGLLLPAAICAALGSTEPEQSPPSASAESDQTQSCVATISPISTPVTDDTPDQLPDGLSLAEACAMACGSAYSIGCAGVAALCPIGSAMTLGSLTIPCATAVIAACGVVQPVGVVGCVKLCVE